MVTFLDLCSGIGGGRLGLEQNGFKCVGFSEILNTSIQTYKFLYNTENEKELGDLTCLNIRQIPDADLLIAGFPCQSYSIQGLRKGLDDERGKIIFHITNILQMKKIKYFILENVKGLVNHDGGKTLRFIIQLLEQAGYTVYYDVLKSNDFGLPQKRERVYFVGIRNSLKNQQFNFPKPFEKRANLQDYLIDDDEKYVYRNYTWLEKYINNKYNVGKYNIDEILQHNYWVIDTRQSDLRIYKDYIPTLRTGRSGILYVRDGTLRKLSGREALLLQGFGMKIFHRTCGFNDNLLLQQTGNAMSVPVIKEIGKSLSEVMALNGDL